MSAPPLMTDQNKKVDDYRPAWGMQIPYGKHINRTVEWVYENEPGYWNWMMANEILPAWGLIESTEPKRVQALAADDGLRWICLLFTPITNGSPSKWLD